MARLEGVKTRRSLYFVIVKCIKRKISPMMRLVVETLALELKFNFLNDCETKSILCIKQKIRWQRLGSVGTFTQEFS